MTGVVTVTNSGDQDLVQHRARLERGEAEHRADQDAAGPSVVPKRRRMHALVEGLEPQQAERADEREAGAASTEQCGQQRRRGGQSAARRSFDHLAAQQEPGERRGRDEAEQGDHQRHLEVDRASARMPKVSISSMALTYSVSSASTRSCARGPRSRRNAAQAIASARRIWASVTRPGRARSVASFEDLHQPALVALLDRARSRRPRRPDRGRGGQHALAVS